MPPTNQELCGTWASLGLPSIAHNAGAVVQLIIVHSAFASAVRACEQLLVPPGPIKPPAPVPVPGLARAVVVPPRVDGGRCPPKECQAGHFHSIQHLSVLLNVRPAGMSACSCRRRCSTAGCSLAPTSAANLEATSFPFQHARSGGARAPPPCPGGRPPKKPGGAI